MVAGIANLIERLHSKLMLSLSQMGRKAIHNINLQNKMRN